MKIEEPAAQSSLQVLLLLFNSAPGQQSVLLELDQCREQHGDQEKT